MFSVCTNILVMMCPSTATAACKTTTLVEDTLAAAQTKVGRFAIFFVKVLPHRLLAMNTRGAPSGGRD